MRPVVFLYPLLFFIGLALPGCEGPFPDVLPPSYFMIQLNPDDIHLYNNGASQGVRLDPLVNDSIKVEVTISYSTPNFGTITFVEREGWFYQPHPDFLGIDNITYTVCHGKDCYSASITMYVEPPVDLNNCTFSITGESVETEKGQPIGIRIFDNDVVCPYQGSALFAPEKGTFKTVTYSGTFKNTVYVYYPPKGFTGTDRFRYRLTTPEGYLEATCIITVK